MPRQSMYACFLITAFLALVPPGCERRKGTLDNAEQAKLIQAAKAECTRLNVPTDNREVTVTAEGEQATVTFHLPTELGLGGDFIVKINRKTGEITDVKIWR